MSVIWDESVVRNNEKGRQMFHISARHPLVAMIAALTLATLVTTIRLVKNSSRPNDEKWGESVWRIYYFITT